MVQQKYEIGMVGLGVMGRNLVLNIADHGYSVSGYDKALSQVQQLQTEAGSRTMSGTQQNDALGYAAKLSSCLTALSKRPDYT